MTPVVRPPPPSRPPSRVRAWLVLSRGSNLPTVWSNCLAGWFLGGGRCDGLAAGLRLAALLAGASLLYTAGMWLNDAHDSAFDARFRPERPIPAGAISRRAAAWAGGAAVLLGWVCLLPLGVATAGWTLVLTGCIEAYNGVHKRWPHASLLMAGCRFCLYPLAASVGAGGVAPLAVVGGAALAVYVAGITYLARLESLPGETPPRWPWLLLAAPLFGWIAVSFGTVGYNLQLGWVLLWPFGIWSWRAWGKTLRGQPPIGDLLAGIALVDLALSPSLAPGRVITFAALFVAARTFQRVIPAT